METIAASFLILFLFVIGIAIFYLICYWKIFSKAGMPGWAILVPVYNLYVYTKIIKRPSWWLAIYFVPNLISLLIGLAINSMPGIIIASVVISFIVYIAVIVIGIIDTVKLARVFGKDSGFALGLIFLGFIFVPILAFGTAEYEISNASSGELLD
jgi:hypothetical protein